MRVGVDTGGTFTDLVTHEGHVTKVPSTPDDPARAVRRALERAAEAPATVEPTTLAHGTTVATNALLERKVARVALVVNAGLADELEIARQARPSLYDPEITRPEPLVPRDLRFEIRGRLDARGEEVEALQLGDLAELERQVQAGRIDAVAVCLLHADLDARHEVMTANWLRDRAAHVVSSHEVSPQHREFERMVTTVVDAALGPACSGYLRELAAIVPEVGVMTSAGGLTDLESAARHPVTLLLSGPAGGLLATAAIARACGYPDAVGFDMGGTSTDVGLVLDGEPEPAGDRVVAGFAIRTPSLAIHTVGAGGGSIARIDAGGALVVGPESAGARPGPAAYGHGGVRPTVTDADVLLGRIPHDSRFAGLGRLDVDAANRACRLAGVEPDGVVAVVDAAMTEAVRVMTVQRGVDPRSVALVAFGGAGPLHACAVAEQLGVGTVIVPPRAGVWSAVGLLCAPRRRDFVRSVRAGNVDAAVAALTHDAERYFGDGVQPIFSFECRYEGQAHELAVENPTSFADAHLRRNGFVLDRRVEVVIVRARVETSSPVQLADLSVPARSAHRGPAVIVEADCTIFVPKGWSTRVGPLGAYLMERS